MQNLPNPFSQNQHRFIPEHAPATLGAPQQTAATLPRTIPMATGQPTAPVKKQLSANAPKDFAQFLQRPEGLTMPGHIENVSVKDNNLAQSFNLGKAAQQFKGGPQAFQQALNTGPQIPNDTLSLRNVAGADEFGNDQFTQQNTLPYFAKTEYQPDEKRKAAFDAGMQLQDRRMDAIADFNAGKFSGAVGPTTSALTERQAPRIGLPSRIGGNMSDYKAGKLANEAAKLGQDQTQHEDFMDLRRQELTHKKQLEKAQQQNEQAQYNNKLRRQKVQDAFKQYNEGKKANQPNYHKVGDMLIKAQGDNAELVSPEKMLGLNPQQSQMMGAILNAQDPEQANAMAQKYGITPSMLNMYKQYTGAM